MKILILTEGGKNIGFGHITRCMSLYEAFEEKGITPKIIVSGDDTVTDLLKGKDYQILDWINHRDRVFESADNNDVILIDSYLADSPLYERISTLAKMPVYMDDNKRLDYPEGIVVNGGILAEELGYPEKDGLIYLLGSRFSISRKIFWRAPRKEIREQIKTIMLTFGGDDSKNMTPKILKFLIENYQEAAKKVMIGRGFNNQNIEEIERLKDYRTELVFYPDAERMEHVMAESDIAISAGGQTLYELAGVGVPAIVIAVAENQLNNIHGWQKIGCIEYAGWYDDKDLFGHIGDILKDLNYKKRKAFSDRCRKIVDGQGAKRVVEGIIGACRA